MEIEWIVCGQGNPPLLMGMGGAAIRGAAIRGAAIREASLQGGSAPIYG